MAPNPSPARPSTSLTEEQKREIQALVREHRTPARVFVTKDGGYKVAWAGTPPPLDSLLIYIAMPA
jgi:hypothetical protein